MNYLPRIASSVRTCTVINESPANEVLIVFKAPICSTQHQTLSNIVLNYDNHVVLAMVERHLLKVPVLGIEPLIAWLESKLLNHSTTHPHVNVRKIIPNKPNIYLKTWNLILHVNIHVSIFQIEIYILSFFIFIYPTVYSIYCVDFTNSYTDNNR